MAFEKDTLCKQPIICFMVMQAATESDCIGLYEEAQIEQFDLEEKK